MASSKDNDSERLAEIFETLLAFARQEFWQRAPVTGSGDTIDAIAEGLNMLAEELRYEVASRRELEATYRELKEAQAQVAHAGKLAAIGQLASGVAHEINNPATAVSMTLALSQRRLRAVREKVDEASAEAVSTVLTILDDARTALDRIRTVTGDLRTFARADDDLREVHSLNDTVEIACRLAAPTVRARAHLLLELSETPPVRASRARMAQVVTNLVINAAQAVGDGDADRHEVVVITRAHEGGTLLAVEDTGPGVPVADRERIFEPFFTTKAPDLGTGLGLALVATIVHSHQGEVRVVDGQRSGARVEVWLPAARPSEERAQRTDAGSIATGLRVLIVDDEALVRVTLGDWLEEEHGCMVVAASSGTEAIDVLARGDDFDLILCDVHMPQTDGTAVYRWIGTSRPELSERFSFLTGGVLTAQVRHFIDGVPSTLLHKPISEAELCALLAESSARRCARLLR